MTFAQWVAGYAALWVVLLMLTSNTATAGFGAALSALIAGGATFYYAPALIAHFHGGNVG